MELSDNEVKILMQALICLQQNIANKREHICTEYEAEQIKLKLWNSIN